MGHFLDAVKRANVVQSINAGRQASVETEDLVVDESSEREVVEEIGEVLPDVGIAILPVVFRLAVYYALLTS